jgi:O-methyltransferase involved in polyketide biosynthesis
MSLIKDVSDTAIWVALYRARESERPDAMFHDPLARLLTGERGEQMARSFGNISRYTEWSVTMRTVLIDEFIIEAIRDGVDAVVNLGAGFPHIVEYKRQKLQGRTPRCRLQCVGVDLADPVARRALLASIAPEAKKILVLTEGVVPYLTEAQVAELAEDLRAQSRVACWITEYFAPQAYRYLRSTARMRQMVNAPFQFFPADWDGFFLRHGWARQQIRYPGEVARRFKRMPPMPWWGKLLMRFVSKERREQIGKMTGYLLMVPRPPSL